MLISNSWHPEEKERHAIEVLIRQRCSALVVHAKTLSDKELASFMQQVPGQLHCAWFRPSLRQPG
ncbi:hypothetical protein [Candidatus Pantoea persica]|uniref:hypothetical protein n=1 Tax=Candidatus Pantoea persica TaxID=2518128 RepID=UPI00215DA3DC|nr:hypothetical protein [Candidatus Pantoea persica]